MELLNVNIPSWSDMGHWIPEAVLCVGFLVALLGDHGDAGPPALGPVRDLGLRPGHGRRLRRVRP